MQILYLESINSTQEYLKELIKSNKISSSIAVVADVQTAGLGSRGTTWRSIEKNLFLSFAVSLSDLPEDLKLESASIYFSYILKETLNRLGSKVWIKWPNDIYIDDIKIGGVITNIVGKNLVCGVGLNIAEAPENFAKLDIEVDRNNLINVYLMNIEKRIAWKQVFSKYKLEFYKNQNFFTHNNNLRFSLKDAALQSDGSIVIDGERMYSLR